MPAKRLKLPGRQHRPPILHTHFLSHIRSLVNRRATPAPHLAPARNRRVPPSPFRHSLIRISDLIRISSFVIRISPRLNTPVPSPPHSSSSRLPPCPPCGEHLPRSRASPPSQPAPPPHPLPSKPADSPRASPSPSHPLSSTPSSDPAPIARSTHRSRKSSARSRSSPPPRQQPPSP